MIFFYFYLFLLKVNNNKSELAPLGRSRMEIYTHNFSPGMKITVEKIKILGITIPTNGKYEDLIIKFVYRLHIETVLSLFFYSKTLLYLSIALWLFLEFLAHKRNK
jgi:hypothetical protein